MTDRSRGLSDPSLIVHFDDGGSVSHASLVVAGRRCGWIAHDRYASFSEGWRPRTSADDVSDIREWSWFQVRDGKLRFGTAVGRRTQFDYFEQATDGATTVTRSVSEGSALVSEEVISPAPIDLDEATAVFDSILAQITDRMQTMGAIARAAIARAAPGVVDPHDFDDFCMVGWTRDDAAGSVSIAYKGMDWAGRATYQAGADDVSLKVEAAPRPDDMSIDSWLSDGLLLEHLGSARGRWSATESWRVEPDRLVVTLEADSGAVERITVPAPAAGVTGPATHEVQAAGSAAWTAGPARLSHRDAVARVAALRAATAFEQRLAGAIAEPSMAAFDAPAEPPAVHLMPRRPAAVLHGG